VRKGFLIAAAAAACAGAWVSPAGTARPHASAARPAPISIRGVAVRGRVATVAVRVRGWRPGARVRIFVDGRYNDFSTNPRLALALNVKPGIRRISADMLVRGRHTARSRVRTVRVRPQPGPVIAAAGDIACDPADPSFAGGRGTAAVCRAAATASVIDGARPVAVLPLGDEQYECGSLSAFTASYALSWGRFDAISRPIPGNHDYSTDPSCGTAPGAGYFSYFGPRAAPPYGYYSYEVGSWHVIALNSECAFVPGGCGPGSAEEAWLRADLAAHPTACTLAYWHRPRWSGTAPGAGDGASDAFWRDLVAAHADVVLNGHRHLYMRFAPLDAAGGATTVGPRQFVVGTGGANLFGQPFTSVIEAHEQTEYGVLLLTLASASYSWNFEPERGGLFTDHGSARCA
jgi:hypothetical protein